MSSTTKKRKADSTDDDGSAKRVKITSDETRDAAANILPPTTATESKKGDQHGTATVTRKRIRKLVPARPFPTVPTSVSATGPRSAHREGKNVICLTRKTPLGAYMRRCKDVVVKDGYKTLHLSAMGAAIPHLLQLACGLPPILPFPPEEIHQEIKTGTLEVQDEVFPEDEDEDISYQTRSKSTLSVVIRIGNGEFEGDRATARRFAGGKELPSKGSKPMKSNSKLKVKSQGVKSTSSVIFEEPEQELMDTL